MSDHWPTNTSIREFLEFDSQVNEIGPPVYFVITGGLDFSINLNRILIDTEYEWSIPNQILRAGKFSLNNYIHPTDVNSWWNDFQNWLKTPECCRRTVTDSKLCQPGEQNLNECYFCDIIIDSHKKNPTKQFYFYLSQFLLTKPAKECPYGGIGRYQGKVNGLSKNGIDYVIKGFHTVLQTTEDHIRALQSARNLCANMTQMAHTYLGMLGLISSDEIAKFQIFPYSPFYMFYDQYLEIWTITGISIAMALTTIFGIHLIMSGLNWVISVLVLLSVSVITVDIFGCMYLWSVSATAVTISFAVICIGIAPRFVVFFLDTYGQSLHRLPEQRQANAVQIVANPILWGVIGNKLFWLAPLGFTDLVYLKLYSIMIISGILNGLFYVPTLVYIFS